MKKKAKKDKMTLDNLADMVQRGFVDVEERLGKRIDGSEERLGSRMDGVEVRLDGVEVRLSGVEKRLDEVVFDVSDLKKGQEEILRKLDDKVERKDFLKLERRVRFLEKVLVRQKKD